MHTEKTRYESPMASVTEVRTEGFLCASEYTRQMKFGAPNLSGDIDDDDVFDGGSF